MAHGRGMLLAILATLSALVFASTASAATIPVTNTTDADPGSLRDAITQANAAVGSDVIDATAVSGTIDLQSALPTLDDPVEIRGPGVDELTVRRDPAAVGNFRIFYVTLGPSTISGMTVANGADDIGGAIRADHNLLLDHVVVTNSTASMAGGGVFSAAALTVRDSTILGNSSTGLFGGGGIYHEGQSIVIQRSTVRGNSAPTSGSSGGGLRLSLGTATISNSTITGNSAAATGGGIFANLEFDLDALVTNSTVVANTAPSASNLQYQNGQSLTLKSSILSGPLGGGSNCGGNTITSGGFNIASDASCGLNQTSDQPSTNPGLGALGDNGGPTLTMAPSANSRAIDKGAFGVEPRDQRGLDRPVDMPAVANAPGGLGVDVGAVEVQTSEVSAPSASVTSGPNGPTTSTRPSFGFSASNARTVQCSIDQGTPAYGPCTTANSHTPAGPLADGSWIFRVRAVAITGVEAVESRSFAVDTAPPGVSVDSGPNGRTLDETPTFSFSANERVTFTCRIGQGDFGPCTGPGQTHSPGTLADGSYTFEVRAADAAGNQATASRAFVLSAAACRQALAAVVAANQAVTKAEAKLAKAKASDHAKRIRKAKKALKKAKQRQAATSSAVDEACVTSGA